MDLYGNQTLGIFVMTVEDYLNGFYPSYSAVHDLYESLQAVISETSHAQRKLIFYPRHWPSLSPLLHPST